MLATRAATACPVGQAPREHEADLESIRGKATKATALVVAGAVASAVPLGLADPYLAILPCAFVLGWLNLVGL
ncbi:MAG: hypothetical protein ACJ768_06385 [Gaiellaceae bacterium]